MGEDVLLTVDPEVGETFLGRVENFGQVAKTAFLVEDFVGLRELLSVGAWCAVGFEDFAQPFYLVKKSLACPLTIL